MAAPVISQLALSSCKFLGFDDQVLVLTKRKKVKKEQNLLASLLNGGIDFYSFCL